MEMVRTLTLSEKEVKEALLAYVNEKQGGKFVNMRHFVALNGSQETPLLMIDLKFEII